MLPTSADPSIVGVVSFVDEVVVVIVGASGGVVSISIVISEDSADSLPAASVDLTLKLWLPSLNSNIDKMEKFPSESAVAVPRDSSPLKSSTALPASAIPSIVGVFILVINELVVITGASGAVVSIVKASSVEADDVFPAASVAVTVNW